MRQIPKNHLNQPQGLGYPTHSKKTPLKSRGNGLNFDGVQGIVRADRSETDRIQSYHGLRQACDECDMLAIPGDNRCYTHALA
jgi:hypothetical protein